MSNADLSRRVIERMERDGIPRGTDHPELLALGALPLCPEHELRAAMDDGEFWAHVLLPPGDDREYDPDDDPNIPDLAEYELNARLAGPCPECGQHGACAYDDEGRPLIHVTDDEEES
jgi:hypothetical protein